MIDGEDSFEATRRELTAALFETNRENHEIGYGIDKALISLSAGSLLFSMTFISALAPGKRCLTVLFLAWTCFAASIVCVIISMRKAHTASSVRAEQLSDLLAELEKQKAPGLSVTPRIAMTRDPARVRLNTWAIWAFLAGVICLGIFVGINLSSPDTPPNSRKCPPNAFPRTQQEMAGICHKK